jgi:hypothetical protein
MSTKITEMTQKGFLYAPMVLTATDKNLVFGF